MSTFREIIYMIQDKCKFDTDDSYFTQEHIMYLIGKYRALLFQGKYGEKNIKKQIPLSNRQEICIGLEQVPGNKYAICESGMYLRSTEPIPGIMPYTKPSIYTNDIYSTISTIDLIYYDRMKYVGNGKYFKKIIYASIAPDGYLYMKSQNPVFINLEMVRMSAVFEDIELAAKLSCNYDCDFMDMQFPMEDSLIPLLIDSIYKELVGELHVPEDNDNDADDNQQNKVNGTAGSEQ